MCHTGSRKQHWQQLCLWPGENCPHFKPKLSCVSVLFCYTLPNGWQDCFHLPKWLKFDDKAPASAQESHRLRVWELHTRLANKVSGIRRHQNSKHLLIFTVKSQLATQQKDEGNFLSRFRRWSRHDTTTRSQSHSIFYPLRQWSHLPPLPLQPRQSRN